MDYQNRTVAYYTLGCKLNFAESSTLAVRLAEMGFKRNDDAPSRMDDSTPTAKVRDARGADLVVVNTCAVTEQAAAKCRQQIRRLVRQNPEAYVVVMGCYAQLDPSAVAALGGVDVMVGSEYKGENLTGLLGDLSKKPAPEILTTRREDILTFHGSCSGDDRTRHFLKVQDGCDYFCTYCTIPMARGRSRSPRVAELVEQARGVAAAGGREVVLTGVNIGDFGRQTGETFFDLLRALDDVDGIERYRISSCEPNLLSDDIIRWVASSRRFAPHFHIPLQAGSDEVLRLMRRRYDTALFRHKVELIREVMPDAFVGVDVMAGMRGETDELFERSLAFLDSLPVSQLHPFTYSERSGTKALDIRPVIPVRRRHERTARLVAMSERKLRAFYAAQAGSEHRVLWEEPATGRPMLGFTENYVRVVHEPVAAWVGTVRPVRLGATMVELPQGPSVECVADASLPAPAS